jgi:hypothetical protein
MHAYREQQTTLVWTFFPWLTTVVAAVVMPAGQKMPGLNGEIVPLL